MRGLIAGAPPWDLLYIIVLLLLLLPLPLPWDRVMGCILRYVLSSSSLPLFASEFTFEIEPTDRRKGISFNAAGDELDEAQDETDEGVLLIVSTPRNSLDLDRFMPTPLSSAPGMKSSPTPEDGEPMAVRPVVWILLLFGMLLMFVLFALFMLLMRMVLLELVKEMSLNKGGVCSGGLGPGLGLV